MAANLHDKVIKLTGTVRGWRITMFRFEGIVPKAAIIGGGSGGDGRRLGPSIHAAGGGWGGNDSGSTCRK